MTTSTDWAIPQWDLSDRLAKSLRTANLSVQEMADYFDVHRNTVSGWMHGRIRPDTRTLRLWAMRTGVPYAWLKDGISPNGDGNQPDGWRTTKRVSAQILHLPIAG